jgi:hypothetical protein
MVTKDLKLAALLLAASLPCAGPGCNKPAAQPVEEDHVVPPVSQEDEAPKRNAARVDDDTIRVRLLMLDAVQKDLGLREDQVRQLKAVLKSSLAQWHVIAQELGKILPPSFPVEETEARMAEYRHFEQEVRTGTKQVQAKTLGMLTPSQLERLKQIQLQASIPDALHRPEVIKALGISEEQYARLRAIGIRMEQEISDKRGDLSGLSPKQRRQALIQSLKEADQLRVEAAARMLEVLTVEQRAELEKLQGKKVDTTFDWNALVPEDAGLPF